MSTPLSFCDISARYGQTPEPQQTLAEKTGWNSKQLFMSYVLKLREQSELSARQAKEDALMAMIDAMNASDEDAEELAQADSLSEAGKAIAGEHTTIMEDGTKRVEWFDPTQTLAIQAMLSCLGDRVVFEQADEIQENWQQSAEQQEQLEVTEARGPSSPNTMEGR